VVGRDVPAFFLAPIHRSAWKGNSANFAFWGFSEVRINAHRTGAAQCSPNFAKSSKSSSFA
jgi:hypothetical protein